MSTKQSMQNWILISSVFDAIKFMEKQHRWDLSTEEAARFAQSIYADFHETMPSSVEEIDFIIDNANINVWGPDHQCTKMPMPAIRDFMYCINQYFFSVLDHRLYNKYYQSVYTEIAKRAAYVERYEVR